MARACPLQQQAEFHVSRSHLTPPCLPRAQGTFVLLPSKVSQHPCEVGRDSGPPRCPTGSDVSVAFPKAPARPAPALGRMVGGQMDPGSGGRGARSLQGSLLGLQWSYTEYCRPSGSSLSLEDMAHGSPGRPSSCLGEYWGFAGAKKGNKVNQKRKQQVGLPRGRGLSGRAPGLRGSLPSG